MKFTDQMQMSIMQGDHKQFFNYEIYSWFFNCHHDKTFTETYDGTLEFCIITGEEKIIKEGSHKLKNIAHL